MEISIEPLLSIFSSKPGRAQEDHFEQDKAGMRIFFRRVLRCLALCAFLAAPLMLGYILLLRSVGELLGSRALARLSLSEPILWQSAYWDSAYYFKPGIAALRRPRVIALGSSRVMPMRAEMFRGSGMEFYNLGRSFQSIRDFSEALSALEKSDARPELIFIEMDWWWLQTASPSPPSPGRWRKKFPALIEAVLLWRERWRQWSTSFLDQIQLMQKAWRDPRFYHALADRGRREPLTGRKLVGLGAYLGTGFRNDGSISYWKQVLEYETKGVDAAVLRQMGLDRIKKGEYRGNYIEEGVLGRIGSFARYCKQHGIRVVIFLPPVEGSVLSVLKKDEYASGFWRLLAERVGSMAREEGVPFFDFSDPGILGLDHRYFVDWMHAGETAFGHMLLAMARSTETAWLSAYVDAEALRRDIGKAPSTYRIYKQ